MSVLVYTVRGKKKEYVLEHAEGTNDLSFSLFLQPKELNVEGNVRLGNVHHRVFDLLQRTFQF
jgi:hypothetical protein